MAIPILVFGSNLAGRHGRGAARTARQFHGAEPGVGEGLTGDAYALPTKDAELQSLPLQAVSAGIERFLAFARERTDLTFEVTRVGCGLAGFADEAVAPAFADAPANCILPFVWQRLLGLTDALRVVVAGPRSYQDYPALAGKLDALLANVRDRVTIISGSERGTDRMAEQYSVGRGLPIQCIPANWGRYGKAASMLRNQRKAWIASHLVAFWDDHSADTRHMIGVAREGGLDVRVVRY